MTLTYTTRCVPMDTNLFTSSDPSFPQNTEQMWSVSLKRRGFPLPRCSGDPATCETGAILWVKLNRLDV